MKSQLTFSNSNILRNNLISNTINLRKIRRRQINTTLRPRILNFNNMRMFLPRTYNNKIQHILISNLIMMTSSLNLQRNLMLPIRTLKLRFLLMKNLIMNPIRSRTNLTEISNTINRVSNIRITNLLRLLRRIRAKLRIISITTNRLISRRVTIRNHTNLNKLTIRKRNTNRLQVRRIIRKNSVTMLINIPTRKRSTNMINMMNTINILNDVEGLIPNLRLMQNRMINKNNNSNLTSVRSIKNNINTLINLDNIRLFLK